jgi:uncharacterized protein YdaU (DUF1376 family)
MAKDPAFLFYASDFLTGTMFMTNEQVGLYIRLLCAQHQHGGKIYTNVLRTQCDSITGGDTIFAKFDHDGEFSFNTRLRDEMQKRAEKADKARDSVNKRWEKHRYDSNTNVLRSEDVNVIVNKDVSNNAVVIKNKAKSKKIKYPNIEEVAAYFKENGYDPKKGEKAWKYYAETDWKDSQGNTVRNWKQKMQGVWFKDENKLVNSQTPKMVY